MKTFRMNIEWPITSLIFFSLSATATFAFRDLWGLWCLMLSCIMTSAAFTSRIIIDEKGLYQTSSFFPFLPRFQRTIKWEDVITIRGFLGPFLIEGSGLTLIAHSSSGKQIKIHIPIVVYAHRKELLREIFSSLPPHVQVSPDLKKWAETVGITPPWQLWVALAILLLLGGLVWFISFK